MSGNSWTSALQTAPIVNAFWRPPSPAPSPWPLLSDVACASAASARLRPACGTGAHSAPRRSAQAKRELLEIPSSACVIGQLVLADLQLIALLQAMRVDPRAIHVCAVQRTTVVEVPGIAATDQQSVVARNGHVVEEDIGVGAPADAHPLAVDGKALARTPSAGTDHERRPVRGHLAELHRHQLACVVDSVGSGHRLARGSLAARQQRAAARTVVGALVAEKAALGAMQSHELPRPSSTDSTGERTSERRTAFRHIRSRAGHG